MFLAASTIDAQTAASLSELTPVSSNIGKFTKKVPKYKGILGESYDIKFDVKIENVNLPPAKKAVAVVIETRATELVFEPVSDQPTARTNFYGRITSKDKITDGFFEEKIITEASVEELSDVSKMKSVTLRKVFALPAGKYQIGVIVRDLISGMRGVKIVKFEIP